MIVKNILASKGGNVITDRADRRCVFQLGHRHIFVLAILSLPVYAASFDSTTQTSPHPKHLKTCNFVNDEIFGLMQTRVIGNSQSKHDA